MIDNSKSRIKVQHEGESLRIYDGNLGLRSGTLFAIDPNGFKAGGINSTSTALTSTSMTNTFTGGTTAFTSGATTFTSNPVKLVSSPLYQSGLSLPLITNTVKTSAAGYTLTAAHLLGGMVTDTTSTGPIAVPMPTVAAVVALLPDWVAGTSFQFIYRNPGNQTVTLGTDASTQWTMNGTMTIATLNAKLFVCIIASAVTGTVYSIGTFVM